MQRQLKSYCCLICLFIPTVVGCKVFSLGWVFSSLTVCLDVVCLSSSCQQCGEGLQCVRCLSHPFGERRTIYHAHVVSGPFSLFLPAVTPLHQIRLCDCPTSFLHSAVLQKYRLLLGILQKTDKPECSGLPSLPLRIPIFTLNWLGSRRDRMSAVF